MLIARIDYKDRGSCNRGRGCLIRGKPITSDNGEIILVAYIESRMQHECMLPWYKQQHSYLGFLSGHATALRCIDLVDWIFWGEDDLNRMDDSDGKVRVIGVEPEV